MARKEIPKIKKNPCKHPNGQFLADTFPNGVQ
jgi:hypothetical protein